MLAWKIGEGKVAGGESRDAAGGGGSGTEHVGPCRPLKDFDFHCEVKRP